MLLDAPKKSRLLEYIHFTGWAFAAFAWCCGSAYVLSVYLGMVA